MIWVSAWCNEHLSDGHWSLGTGVLLLSTRYKKAHCFILFLAYSDFWIQNALVFLMFLTRFRRIKWIVTFFTPRHHKYLVALHSSDKLEISNFEVWKYSRLPDAMCYNLRLCLHSHLQFCRSVGFVYLICNFGKYRSWRNFASAI